jgi:hypothetical protein
MVLKIACGFSERGLSEVKITVSAVASASLIGGRFCLSRSPPQPATTFSLPSGRSRRAMVSARRTVSGVCA